VTFFSLILVIVIAVFGVAAEQIEGGRVARQSKVPSFEIVYILSSLSTLTHVCVACQKTFVKRRPLFLGIMAMSCFFVFFLK
jgi:hypothetical protein